MNNKFILRLRLFLFHFLIILFLINSPHLCNCQEKFLINNTDLLGYELINHHEFHWIISDKNEMQNTIRQKWHIAGKDKEQNIYIEYGEFNTELQAISGTAYAANSNAEPYIWGSLSGPIEGDGSWVAIGDGAMYLVRGNVGIVLFKPLNFNETDRPAMHSIAAILLNKIESNLSPEIAAFEAAAKQKQISMATYQQITDQLVHSQLMNAFILHSTWDSKWLVDSESIAMGIRKEWKDTQGATIGIDICQLDSDSVASKAASFQKRITYNDVVDLSNLDSLPIIISDWQNKWKSGLPQNFFSVIGLKGNIAIQVYQFNSSGIDINFFYSIVEKLSKQI